MLEKDRLFAEVNLFGRRAANRNYSVQEALAENISAARSRRLSASQYRHADGSQSSRADRTYES
jgi:hypothetical protein